jgi:hypothetical protein
MVNPAEVPIPRGTAVVMVANTTLSTQKAKNPPGAKRTSKRSFHPTTQTTIWFIMDLKTIAMDDLFPERRKTDNSPFTLTHINMIHRILTTACA